MTNKEKVKEFIHSLLIDYGESMDFSDDTSLILSGILDSLAVLSIVVFLEQEFNLDLAKRGFDQNNFDTLASIMQLISDLE